MKVIKNQGNKWIFEYETQAFIIKIRSHESKYHYLLSSHIHFPESRNGSSWLATLDNKKILQSLQPFLFTFCSPAARLCGHFVCTLLKGIIEVQYSAWDGFLVILCRDLTNDHGHLDPLQHRASEKWLNFCMRPPHGSPRADVVTWTDMN